MTESGLETLLDERDARPGEKFADADLIGAPVRVTVGRKTIEDGAVDVRLRERGEERRVAAGELAGSLPALLGKED
ncbi:MAG: His/Gly/Thr/Pro-type tRNA ligase C-terminal domain-containing protein [Gaiellaceae bacterium]